ncbi:VWA1 protein, partial [Atractosteus spatula]|nr:VWA1 protein [Atractosteus spatula]
FLPHSLCASASRLSLSVAGCCEGDLLFLVDSSGSISSYEYSRILSFLGDLLVPFSLGPDEVQVGVLQVGTSPRLEFGFGRHQSQAALQEALRGLLQLQGDTNTGAALALARERLLQPGPGGARPGVPKVLVWLTDGVMTGSVLQPMAELRQAGVAVLVVSTGYGNLQELQRVVTPPEERHLQFVDIDSLGIITSDLRDAIIDLIRMQRFRVQEVTSRSALLQWHPVLTKDTGHYEIEVGPVGGPPDRNQRLTHSGDTTSAHLTGLQPDTRYTATLTPESNELFYRPRSVTFTTLPARDRGSYSSPLPSVLTCPPVFCSLICPPPVPLEELSPAQVLISDSSAHSLRVSWGPLQPDSVQEYLVQFGALPADRARTVTVSRLQNSTVLHGLQPDTSYLVTVSARYQSGQERAMSVKACTQEVLPALSDLQLTPAGGDSVRVSWREGKGVVQGYWLSWTGESPSGPKTSRYLPPDSLSTLLTGLPPVTRVCVSPVYRTARGEGLCCTAHLN